MADDNGMNSQHASQVPSQRSKQQSLAASKRSANQSACHNQGKATSPFPRTLDGENRTKFVNVAKTSMQAEQSDVSVITPPKIKRELKKLFA